MYIPTPFAQPKAARHSSTDVYPPTVGTIYPIPTHISIIKLSYTPQLLATYIQYKCIKYKIYIP